MRLLIHDSDSLDRLVLPSPWDPRNEPRMKMAAPGLTAYLYCPPEGWAAPHDSHGRKENHYGPPFYNVEECLKTSLHASASFANARGQIGGEGDVICFCKLQGLFRKQT